MVVIETALTTIIDSNNIMCLDDIADMTYWKQYPGEHEFSRWLKCLY